MYLTSNMFLMGLGLMINVVLVNFIYLKKGNQISQTLSLICKYLKGCLRIKFYIHNPQRTQDNIS